LENPTRGQSLTVHASECHISGWERNSFKPNVKPGKMLPPAISEMRWQ
jgi:hypothetical protein